MYFIHKSTSQVFEALVLINSCNAFELSKTLSDYISGS